MNIILIDIQSESNSILHFSYQIIIKIINTTKYNKINKLSVYIYNIYLSFVDSFLATHQQF